MKFVFFRFRRTEKMESVMKELMWAMLPQNFWTRIAPGGHHQWLVYMSQCNPTCLSPLRLTVNQLRNWYAVRLNVLRGGRLYVCLKRSVFIPALKWPRLIKADRKSGGGRVFQSTEAPTCKLHHSAATHCCTVLVLWVQAVCTRKPFVCTIVGVLWRPGSQRRASSTLLLGSSSTTDRAPWRDSFSPAKVSASRWSATIWATYSDRSIWKYWGRSASVRSAASYHYYSFRLSK